MRHSEVGTKEILQQEAKSQSPNGGSKAGILVAREGLWHLDDGLQIRLPVKDSNLGEPTSGPTRENWGKEGMGSWNPGQQEDSKGTGHGLPESGRGLRDWRLNSAP